MSLGKSAPPLEITASDHPASTDFESPGPFVETQSDHEDQQDGVRVAEAVTSTWSKRSLIITYAS
jgi:hypothetical protein